MSSDRQHLNSLGYVVGGKQRRALIAWAYDASGRRIGIDDADRGGSQCLRCECNTLLVAKKGEIREHHFAHKVGDTRHCERATRGAIAKFISHALLDAGRITLPTTMGVTGYAEVHAVAETDVEHLPVHLVDAQQDRKLLVFTRLKRQNLEVLERWCRSQFVSGVVIDLVSHRNHPDEHIRGAVAAIACRAWIYRSTHNDCHAKRNIVRRLYGL